MRGRWWQQVEDSRAIRRERELSRGLGQTVGEAWRKHVGVADRVCEHGFLVCDPCLAKKLKALKEQVLAEKNSAKVKERAAKRSAEEAQKQLDAHNQRSKSLWAVADDMQKRYGALVPYAACTIRTDVDYDTFVDFTARKPDIPRKIAVIIDPDAMSRPGWLAHSMAVDLLGELNREAEVQLLNNLWAGTLAGHLPMLKEVRKIGGDPISDTQRTAVTIMMDFNWQGHLITLLAQPAEPRSCALDVLIAQFERSKKRIQELMGPREEP